MSDNIPKTKIILFTGGDSNNIDFGIIPASFANILQANDYKVTVIKIEQCINEDTRFLHPKKYGERYILKDGPPVLINFGYYERFTNQFFTADHYITKGKMEKLVSQKLEKNVYNGDLFTGDKVNSSKIVEEIGDWFKKIFEKPIDASDPDSLPEICLIDYGQRKEGNNRQSLGKNFSEAITTLKYDGREFMHIHISKIQGDDITSVAKPLNFLQNHHWDPDMIVCRNHLTVFNKYQQQIADLTDTELFPKKVPVLNVIPKVYDDYQIPVLLQNQKAYQFIAENLGLRAPKPAFFTRMKEKQNAVKRVACYLHILTIAIVGQFFGKPGIDKMFEESDASAIQALKTAAAAFQCRIELVFVYFPHLENDAPTELRNAAFAALEKADGIHCASGNTWGRFYGLGKVCKFAREKCKPFLTFSYGCQVAVIEFVQNVCGLEGPFQPISDEEIAMNEKCNYSGRGGLEFKHVVAAMAENGNRIKGGAKRVQLLNKTSKAYHLYGNQDFIVERHCNRCEVHPALVPRLCAAGLRFVGVSFDESERARSPQILQQLLNAAQHPAEDEEGYIRAIKELSRIFVEDTKKFKTAVRFSMFELKDHPFYVGVNFYTQYGGNLPSDPSPLYLGFIEAAKKYQADQLQMQRS